MTQNSIETAAASGQEPAHLGCPTALVIDDDPTVRESLEILLEHYGFQVAVARNGRQGIAAFRTLAPDVVLTDIMMPEQDGIETIACHGVHANCPILEDLGDTSHGFRDNSL